MVSAVVEVVQDVVAGGPPAAQVTTQRGAVTKALPKVTTHEVDAVVPETMVPEKSVPVRVGEPPVMQAVRTGGAATLGEDRMWTLFW